MWIHVYFRSCSNEKLKRREALGRRGQTGQRRAVIQSYFQCVSVCCSWAEGMDSGCHGNREASTEAECLDAVISCRPCLHVRWCDVKWHLYRSVAFLPSSYLPSAFLNIPQFSPRWYHPDVWCCIEYRQLIGQIRKIYTQVCLLVLALSWQPGLVRAAGSNHRPSKAAFWPFIALLMTDLRHGNRKRNCTVPVISIIGRNMLPPLMSLSADTL